MYVIRSALRASTGRRPAPALFICGRRYPSPLRLRTFHTTRTLRATNPPSAPDSTPIGENDTGKSDREKAVAEEQSDATVATEDPEVLAQKLQRSRETSRRYSAALRRQLRSKKSQGLPPVHIPDWFLKRRVIRREDILDNTKQRPKPAYLSASISHEDTGEEATCSIPTSRDLDTAQVLSRLVRGLWGRRLDDNEKRKVEKFLDDRIALVDKAASAESLETGSGQGVDAESDSASVTDRNTYGSKDSPSFPSLERMFRALMADSNISSEQSTDRGDLLARELLELKKLSNKLDEVRVDPALDPQQRLEAARKHEAKIQRWIKKRVAAKSRRASTSRRISPLMLAEIRATIAASLSTLHPSASDLFPSTKTNLILHSSAAEHERLVDACVHSIADDLGSELIILKAQDLALLVGDYLGEGPEPTPRSIRSLGYETYRLSTELRSIEDEMAESIEEESEFSQPGSMDPPELSKNRLFPIIHMKVLLDGLKAGHIQQENANANTTSEDTRNTQNHGDLQLEDMKLASFLDDLIDASNVKQSRGLIGTDDTTLPRYSSGSVTPPKAPAFFDYSVGSEGTKLDLSSALPANAESSIIMAVSVGSTTPPRIQIPEKSKIIYVKDFKEMNATHYGGRLIQKLEELVRKRRASGESVMIVGSTCSRDLTPELSPSGVRGLQGDGESSYFRTIVVEAESGASQSSLDEAFAASRSESGPVDLSPTEMSKFWAINLAHIRDMLRSLDTVATTNLTNMERSSQLFHPWASIFPESYLKRVLTYDEVHRIAITALGLCVTSPIVEASGADGSAAQVNWAHVILAMGLLRASDTAKYASFDRVAELSRKNSLEMLEGQANAKVTTNKKRRDEKSLLRQRELQLISANANKHEKRLLSGIADPETIKTTFDQVHVPQDTIDSIRTITSLSLLRPDAFNYGILATEKISGALLYGPPGTGKTLLAKAVAKESGSTVLEVSGSSIMDKYVGEGEKNVAAIFSLARKLSPCIVFLDEADAIFASRDVMRERSAHRDILNQFLKEWDGLNDLSVFVMVATNRPFDLDDAVIRRLPRRLLVDLPTQADRKEILRIHLRGEQLDESVDLESIAKRTPFYSGSDLKNIAVSAALACVKEENEHAAAKATLGIDSLSPPTSVPTSQSSETTSTEGSAPAPSPSPPKVLHLIHGQTYSFPEKRILHARHFDKALQEISASISEDMSSLNAIKKFDDQYGDRKSNKRRKDFGFGVLAERDERAARVRV